MKKCVYALLLGVVVLFSMLGFSVEARVTIPDKPLNSTVLDLTGYLSDETQDTINQENASWSETKERLQVGVYMVDSLDGELATIANETFRKWQIGFSDSNNGILLLIAVEDRQFRIETSDQAATVLTDVEAKRILGNSRDFFRNNDYNAGVLYIVDAIGDKFYGTDRASNRLANIEKEQDDDDAAVEMMMVFVFIGVIFLGILSKSKGGRGGGRGGPGSFLWIPASSFSDSSQYSHSSSNSFGSGGWSGGGGGGGGASSGW